LAGLFALTLQNCVKNRAQTLDLDNFVVQSLQDLGSVRFDNLNARQSLREVSLHLLEDASQILVFLHA
jgi:hypothetical protein